MALFEIYGPVSTAAELLDKANIEYVHKLEGLEVADSDADAAHDALDAYGVAHIINY